MRLLIKKKYHIYYAKHVINFMMQITIGIGKKTLNFLH